MVGGVDAPDSRLGRDGGILGRNSWVLFGDGRFCVGDAGFVDGNGGLYAGMTDLVEKRAGNEQ